MRTRLIGSFQSHKTIGVLLIALTVCAAAWVLAANAWRPDASAASSAAALYRCPMHPDRVSNVPGNCPICGMKLLSVSSPGTATFSGAMEISPAQQRTLGLTLAEVKKAEFARSLHLTGHIIFGAADSILAPEAGTVSQVLQPVLNGNAIHVRRGTPLLVLNTPSPLTIRAPKLAALQSLPATGSPVAKSSVVGTYIDLSHLLILGVMQGSDLPYVRIGRPVEIRVPSLPGKVWRGKVTEIAQQFDEQMQTANFRVECPNSVPDIWQGMLVSVDLRVPLGARLSIPEEAIVSGSGSATVFVAKSPTMFEARPVQLGLRSDQLREVTRGLEPGEKVVQSAAFFLDSELRLKSAAGLRSAP